MKLFHVVLFCCIFYLPYRDSAPVMVPGKKLPGDLSATGHRVPATVTWLSPTEHDFGDIALKQSVHHTFYFRNTGTAPLVIDNIRPGCGCTAVDWEDSLIKPDSVGAIRTSYNANVRGYFRKSLKVYFHGLPGAEKLWLEGYVIE